MTVRFLLALAVLLAPAIAQADCDTANKYVFNYSDQPATSLAYGSRYTYSARNGAGATQTFTVDLAQNGLSSTIVGGRTLPEIGTSVTGPNASARMLTLGGTFTGRSTTLSSPSRIITVTLTFTQPVRDVSFTLQNVDYSLLYYRDWVQISGGTASPLIVTPYGSSNATGGTRTSASSSVQLGSGTNPVSLTVNQAAGSSTASNGTSTGEVDASFAEPVSNVTITLGNYPAQALELFTGAQAIGLSGVSYCPLPAVSITKSSAPFATSGDTRFAIPGADMVYTFVLTNSGGSAVDASSLVLTDILPGSVTFNGGAFGGTTTGPVDFTAGTSGLTLPTAGIAYSADGGTTWAYQAGVGYDAAVKGIRLTPSGSLAANSSATIRFRARVN